MPLNLLDLAKSGDSEAVKLMMKWGYEGSKRFIGGNPVEKIIQSPREISEILAVDLVACNNYKNGTKAAESPLFAKSIKSGWTGILFEPPTKTIFFILLLYLRAYSRISKQPWE